MPHRPLSVCAEPGCAKLTRGRRCAEHQAELYRADRQQRGSTTDRGYGWRHQQLTAQTIAAQPWCSICGDTKAQVEARGDQLTGGTSSPEQTAAAASPATTAPSAAAATTATAANQARGLTT